MKFFKSVLLLLLAALLVFAVSCDGEINANGNQGSDQGGNSGSGDSTPDQGASVLSLEQYKKMWKSQRQVTDDGDTYTTIFDSDGNILSYLSEGSEDYSYSREYEYVNGVLRREVRRHSSEGGQYNVSEYDEHGNQTAFRSFNSNDEQTSAREYVNTYDENGKLIRVDEKEYYRLYFYDSKGRPIRIEHHRSSDNKLDSTEKYEYDGEFLFDVDGITLLDFKGTWVEWIIYEESSEAHGYKYVNGDWYDPLGFFMYTDIINPMRNSTVYQYDFERKSWYLIRVFSWNDAKTEYGCVSYDYNETTGIASESGIMTLSFVKNNDESFTLMYNDSSEGYSETGTITLI